MEVYIIINLAGKYMKKEIWKFNGRNYFLKGKGYYVSYNPQTVNHGGYTDIANMLGGLVGLSFKDGEETALFDGKEWRILEGDFRKDYEKCKTFKECLAVYNKNIAHKSTWSTD